MSHFADIANLMVLVIPAVLGLSFFVVRRHRRDNDDAREPWYLACLAVPAIVFLVLFKPELGVARDWDLYALPGLLLLAPILAALYRYLVGGDAVQSRAVVIPALTLSVVLTASWVGINAGEARSVARYKSILGYDTTSEGYAMETLARHYELAGDANEQIATLREAFRRTRNPRYLSKVGAIYYEAGDPQKAVEALNQMLAASPAYDDGRQLLIRILDEQQNARAMIEVCVEGIKHSPNIFEYHFYLGKALIATGQIDGAKHSFERCRRLSPPDNYVRAMEAMLRPVER